MVLTRDVSRNKHDVRIRWLFVSRGNDLMLAATCISVERSLGMAGDDFLLLSLRCMILDCILSFNLSAALLHGVAFAE